MGVKAFIFKLNKKKIKIFFYSKKFLNKFDNLLN